MKRAFLFLFAWQAFSIANIQAQTLIKEAMNGFALYTKTQDMKQLEKARKQIDDAYKTRKDSFTYRNNLIRGLVYSTLAHLDSNRVYSYKKDPINEATLSLQQIKESKSNKDHEPEIDHIKKELSMAYLSCANRALSHNNYSEALNFFNRVDTLVPNNINVIHNLALLNEKTENFSKAIVYYEILINKRPRPEYYLLLSNLYDSQLNTARMMEVLQAGRKKYPENKDLVFKEINILVANQDYPMVINMIGDALKLDEDNINLNYLAGFSYDMTGNQQKAKEYYEKILNIDFYNYDGNYSLGLLYLNSYIRNLNQSQLMYEAKKFLNRANEIDPNDLKTLSSLAILYKHNGDTVQLLKVKNKINQLKLN